MEGKRYKFHVNTSSSCFLCLEQITNANVNFNSFSLKNIFQYLNIELNKIETLSKKPVQLLNRTDIRVSLCSGCENVFNEISKLYKAIEIAQMKLNWNFEAIQKRVKSAFSKSKNIEKSNHRQDEESMERESLRHSKLVKELRKEIIEKCSMKMPNYLPRVNLEQVPGSVIRELTKTNKGQPETKTIEDSTELPDQSEINSDESRDFFEDESSPVLCKVSSIKPEQDDHSRENEVETDHFNLGDEICKINDLRQHKKESPFKIQENKTSKKRVSNGSTIKLNPVGLRTCHICKRVLTTKTKLQDHLRTHTKERPFKCQFCPKSFSYRHVLQKHLIVTHADCLEQVPQRWLKYQCKVCQKLLASKYDLKVHLNKHPSHSNENISGTFHCSKCNKKYPSQYSLKAHYEAVHLQKRFKCNLCKSCYSQKSALQRHTKICRKLIEKKKAREQYAFVCNLCDKRFPGRGILDLHKQRVHPPNGSKPHTCDICGEQYKYLNSLRFHKDEVHLGKKLCCKFCKKLYKCSSVQSFKDHEKKCCLTASNRKT